MSRTFDDLRRVGKVDSPLREAGDKAAPDDRGFLDRNRTVLERESGTTERADLSFQSVDDCLSNGNATTSEIHLNELRQGQIANLVQRVFMFPNPCPPRVIVLASVDKGAGSGEICFAAGQFLASHLSGSVCVVDANLNGGTLQRLMDSNKAPGFTDAITSLRPIRDFAVRVGHQNLWGIPRGTRLKAPGLFAADLLCSRLMELRKMFDYILIDAAPVDYSGDSVVLGQIADGLILVVEANSTRRETARRAKDILEGAKVKLLGAILNNRTFPIPPVIYRRL
jgi:protein-tyrosine kinase